VACAGACASERAATTWGDDAREGIASHTRSESQMQESPGQARPRLSLQDGLEGRSGDAEATQELELALLRFSAKRRSLMARDATPAWPRPMETAWSSMLDQLEKGFARPAGSVPRRLLIQARVGLEVELDATRSHCGDTPQAISDRITHVFTMIAAHMRAGGPEKDERPRLIQDLALAWPISPVIVTSPFGYRRDPILGRTSVRFHAGVDLGGSSGDLVRASGSGYVLSAGWLGGHGRAVIIQHPAGYQTIYAHLRQIIIPMGAEVDAGSPIGFVGSSGRSTGPHLHFEVRQGGVPLDPLDVVEGRGAAAVEHASR
jgi:murein DD-endopeptidase MepM/ murein hydrolase activator NlpD